MQDCFSVPMLFFQCIFFFFTFGKTFAVAFNMEMRLNIGGWLWPSETAKKKHDIPTFLLLDLLRKYL